MKISKTPLRIACAFALSFAVTIDALAQVPTASGTILNVNTGWNADQFNIATTATFVNPANCPNSDGYVSEISHAGFKTHYQAVQMAFALGKPVIIVVSQTECIVGRPKIIGVYVYK